ADCDSAKDSYVDRTEPASGHIPKQQPPPTGAEHRIATSSRHSSAFHPVMPAPRNGVGPEFLMTKELFVSATPHETKVGMVEDDLLAEIYLERENEYTLAGSIYKGRVTRVLPGMQSAFVDIGLERDAFLYVSDFMELEDSEDLDEVPTNRPVLERHQLQPQVDGHNGETFAAPLETES